MEAVQRRSRYDRIAAALAAGDQTPGLRAEFERLRAEMLDAGQFDDE